MQTGTKQDADAWRAIRERVMAEHAKRLDEATARDKAAKLDNMAKALPFNNAHIRLRHKRAR